MKRIFIGTMSAAAILLLSGCTSTSGPAVSHTPDFKAGMNDGCATANGTYTKNSELFRNNNEYQEGWFYGRKTCNPSNSRK